MCVSAVVARHISHASYGLIFLGYNRYSPTPRPYKPRSASRNPQIQNTKEPRQGGETLNKATVGPNSPELMIPIPVHLIYMLIYVYIYIYTSIFVSISINLCLYSELALQPVSKPVLCRMYLGLPGQRLRGGGGGTRERGGGLGRDAVRSEGICRPQELSI